MRDEFSVCLCRKESGDRRSFGAKTAFGEKGSEYLIGKRVLVDSDWECIVETNVTIVEKRTLDCTFLRNVFCCIYRNTYYTKTLLFFLVRYMKYLLYTFFL